MKNKAGRIIAGTVVVLTLVLVFFGDRFLPDNKVYEGYSEFYNLVKEKQIVEVKVTEKKLLYKKATDSEKDGYRYYTENPDSPLLKEYLLINKVKVTVEKGTDETVSMIFDIAFYLIFFGIILVVFRKFISPNTFKIVKKTGKKFDDVIGLESLKKDMIQIMDIMKNPAKYAKMGVRMPKGILLEGDPGNGKTLFAKALAGESKVNFIPAKATDFESMFMAIGPMKVKLLFRKARKAAPCIVFIDEFDGIGTKRNYSGSAIETENTRIVTALLNELDGFEPNKGILVMAATNSIQALDEALIRPGRFDARVKVPYPNERSLGMLIDMYLKGKTVEKDVTNERLVAEFKGFSCAKVESVLNKAVLIGANNQRTVVSWSDIEQAVKEN